MQGVECYGQDTGERREGEPAEPERDTVEWSGEERGNMIWKGITNKRIRLFLATLSILALKGEGVASTSATPVSHAHLWTGGPVSSFPTSLTFSTDARCLQTGAASSQCSQRPQPQPVPLNAAGRQIIVSKRAREESAPSPRALSHHVCYHLSFLIIH